ncbi:hypothetical protein [Halalkalicoccus sp. NIPERK01]|uniref:hypothetical protein n=1 Tax=Halalkalicoccus sp. NIPERK01 TaxID=3053469 RepID=UPI00256F5BAF|nr:hypothetical protein [Halalkalicoccus sp. NIPERK01]MDL5362684.1 hypothetical protein [Halalkalicoccus sp. NIPERK01]
MSDLTDRVRRSLEDATRREFDRRVETQAAFLREQLDSGALDNGDFAVGLELEAYATDADGRLVAVPERVLGIEGCAGELGRHNVEINTPATLLDGAGLDDQTRALRGRLAEARRAARTADRRLVLDAMWTVPPDEGSREYLAAVEERDGVVLAANMRPSPRYHALDNAILAERGGSIDVDLPGLELSLPTILVESLATSMQPHLQIPRAEAFPAYYNAAIRTMGPVLALATNSPFAPADLYPAVEGTDAHALVDATYHELRVPVFERAINVDEEGKVRFPGDVESAADVIDRIAADRTQAPFLSEWTRETNDEYTDRFPEFEHKRGTYWRWLRGVIGGQPIDGANDERSLRIEYRPLPTQPSVEDTVGLQALVAGLLRGLVATDHPLATLGWDDAREGFYDVVRDGFDAEVIWMTADGEPTSDPGAVYGELFDVARRGLRDSGVSRSAVEGYLAPIERRVERETTPSRWKVARVRDRIDDGADLREAIRGMQREYVERAGEPFVAWS